MIHLSNTSIVVVALSVFLSGCTGIRPSNLGVNNGRLAPCPESPNCVSSFSTDQEHGIAPLFYSSSAPDAMADLKKIILNMKRTRIVRESDTYLYVEFTSALWRFVDDVEFSLDAAAKRIDVRSASRVGHSDMGVNRKRVEEIRTAWNARGK